MPADLFSEFPPNNKADWENQARKELREKYEAAVNGSNVKGFHFAPFVTNEELDEAEVTAMQRAQKKVPGWLNVPDIRFDAPAATNLTIKNNLENGADGVLLDLGTTPLAVCEFPKLLHGIRLSDTPVFFKTSQSPQMLFEQISKHAGYYLKGGITFDPVRNYMERGEPIDGHLEQIALLLNATKNMREFRPYAVGTAVGKGQANDPVKELAVIVASLVTYMDFLTDAGITALLAFNRAIVSVSVGTHYLTEIAKLRALRFLLRKVARAYLLPDELASPFLLAKTAAFESAAGSPYDNIIRASSAAMSAVIGGCNALTVSGFEGLSSQSPDFSHRIARNISSILRFESGFEHVADPAAGSFSLESMSLKLAAEAWDLFLSIQDQGGLLACVEKGFIQTMVTAP